MTVLTRDEFETSLSCLVQIRDSADAIERLPFDRQGRFGRGFNRHMGRVDAVDIEAAYFLPLIVLARCIEAGKVADAETLFKLLWGIQKRVGRKLGAKADRRANPQITVRRRKGDPGPAPESRPLFAPDGSELERQPGREGDPAFRLLRGELFKEMLKEVRAMGKLPQRTFREVQTFAERNGSRYGAFKAVAARAKLDERGTVIAIGACNTLGAPEAVPAARTIRQVRSFYADAVGHLSSRGFWDGPSGLE